MYVSSLRAYIEAVGGKLKIVAEFPEGEVAITNFSEVGEARRRFLRITSEMRGFGMGAAPRVESWPGEQRGH